MPELGLHVVVLLGDAAELLRQLLVALLVASVGLLVPLQEKKKKKTTKKKKRKEEENTETKIGEEKCGAGANIYEYKQ